MNHLHIAKFQADAEGKFDYINNEWVKLSGLTREESLGNGWMQVIHPEDKPLVAEAIQIAITDHRDLELSCRLVNRNSQTVTHALIRSQVILDQDGSTKGFSGSVADITSLKIAEEHIRQQNLLLEVYSHMNKIGGWTYDIAAGKINCSAGIYNICELDTNRPLNKEDFARFYTKDTWKKLSNILATIAEERQGCDIEVEMITAAGNKKWVRIILKGDFVKDTLVKIYGTLQDITEKKEAELEFKMKEQRWHFAVDSSGDGLWDWNVVTGKVFYSDQWKRMLGYEPQEIGDSIEEWKNRINPDDSDETYKELDRHFERQTTMYQNEHRIMCKDGRYKWVLDRGKVIEWTADNKPLRIIGTYKDITERKVYEAQLIYAKENAERATKCKSDFLSMMSHELRTPLNALIGNAELLISGNENKNIEEELKTVELSAQNLLTLINDILDYNKIEARKLDIETVEFNLKGLADNILKIHRMKADEKNTPLELIYDNNIPDRLIGDPVRLGQVLNNLISNAIKFTEKGKITLDIKLTDLNKQNAKLTFSIIDTGVGIPVEKQKLIFEKFSQAEEGTARKYGGTGLGLSIVKKLLSLQNSNIQLNSSEGSGSRFHFTISYRMGNNSVSEINQKEETGGYDLKGLKILVVEDNRLNLVMVSKFISRWSGQVDSAENGRIAIEKVKTHDYDLVLMDLQMPEMDGHEATAKIREFDKTIPIIALTASATTDIKNKAMEVGMNDFITKPFHPDNFYNKLRRYCNAA